jgi:hypothetical protein
MKTFKNIKEGDTIYVRTLSKTLPAYVLKTEIFSHEHVRIFIAVRAEDSLLAPHEEERHNPHTGYNISCRYNIVLVQKDWDFQKIPALQIGFCAEGDITEPLLCVSTLENDERLNCVDSPDKISPLPFGEFLWKAVLDPVNGVRLSWDAFTDTKVQLPEEDDGLLMFGEDHQDKWELQAKMDMRWFSDFYVCNRAVLLLSRSITKIHAQIQEVLATQQLLPRLSAMECPATANTITALSHELMACGLRPFKPHDYYNKNHENIQRP